MEARMLLVDDEGFHCERLAQELRALGYAVLMESDPDRALASLRADPPDWAAVEPVLAGSSWFRFLHAVCRARPSLRWIVVTAFASSALAAEAMKLGALDALCKPVTGPELVAACQSRSRLRGTEEVGSDLSLARIEWEHLNKVLRLCRGNVTDAARTLRIPRQTLYNKLRKRPAPPNKA